MLLGLLVGCGLRRGELAGLEFPDVAQVSTVRISFSVSAPAASSTLAGNAIS